MKNCIISALVLTVSITTLENCKEKIKDTGADKIYDERYANIYDTLWHDPDKYHREVGKILSEFKPSMKKQSLLDAGCGTGTHYSLLAKHFEVTGLDISNAMLARARAKNPTGKFLPADLRDKETFTAGQFDFIVSMYEASFYTQEIDKILSNYNHWLKPGGGLLLVTIDPDKLTRERVQDKLDLSHKGTDKRGTTGFFKTGWWQKADAERGFFYHEMIHFNNAETIERHHLLFLPPVKKILRYAEQRGLKSTRTIPSPFFKQETLLFFRKSNISAP